MTTLRHEPIEGLLLAQNTHIEQPFNTLSELNFDCVIELGTQNGGFTIFLSKLFKLVKTFDHTINQKTLSVFTKYPKILLFEMDIFKNVERIGEMIKEGGKVLLLCDNGNKPKEVQTFAKYLKPGDVIMAHDYARDRDYYIKNIQHKYWHRVEIWDKDVADVFKEHNISYYLREETERAAWLCGIKNL